MSAFKRTQQWCTFARVWYLYDAKWQNPFDSAVKINKYLTGKNKPIYHPLNDCGDHVVVINSREIALPGDEWKRRVYFHHTGYPGGATWTLAWELHRKDPTMIMWKAIYYKLGVSLLKKNMMQRVHIFADDNIPEDMNANITDQIRQLRPVPKQLNEYDEDFVRKFPKVVDYPKDYVIR